MGGVDTFSGIFIGTDTGIYDIADRYIPQAALNAWIEGLPLDQARITIRMLIEALQAPDNGVMIGLDAGIPG